VIEISDLLFVSPINQYISFVLLPGLIKHLMKLKERNRELKVLFSVGGWSEGSQKFSDMASNQERRKTFIDSVDQFIR
jgi:GH18 family chitinase